MRDMLQERIAKVDSLLPGLRSYIHHRLAAISPDERLAVIAQIEARTDDLRELDVKICKALGIYVDRDDGEYWLDLNELPGDTFPIPYFTTHAVHAGLLLLGDDISPEADPIDICLAALRPHTAGDRS